MNNRISGGCCIHPRYALSQNNQGQRASAGAMAKNALLLLFYIGHLYFHASVHASAFEGFVGADKFLGPMAECL